MYFCEETGEFIHPIFFDSQEEAREVRATSCSATSSDPDAEVCCCCYCCCCCCCFCSLLLLFGVVVLWLMLWLLFPALLQRLACLGAVLPQSRGT